MARPHIRRTRLHHMCDRAMLTQRSFAELVGIDESTTSMWLSGKRTPLASYIPVVAKALSVQENYMIAVFAVMGLIRKFDVDVCRHIVRMLTEELKERGFEVD